MIAQIPNILSLLRILMVPVIVVLLRNSDYQTALIVFFAAGVSDGLDGYIAKRFQLQSELGAMLDPIADKLLIISTYTMLSLGGFVPFWLLMIVIFRDLIIVGGYWMLVALGDEPSVKPMLVSKLNTLLQIVLVVVVLIALAGWLNVAWMIDGLVYGVAATSLISGVLYVWQGSMHHEES